MSNISELKINALPSKTWYWLNLNDTRVAWDSKTVPCNIETDGYADAFYDAQSNDYADISAAVKTGATDAVDVLFADENITSLVINADKKADNKVIYLNIDDSVAVENKVNQAGKLVVRRQSL